MYLEYTVPQSFDGALVKLFLRSHCSLSYRLMVSLKHVEKGITRNGEHVRVIDRVSAGDVIGLNIPDRTPKAQPCSVEMPKIIFEDEHITVVDKPAHMPVHTSPGHYDDTLANAMVQYDEQRGISRAFRPVYRLDADTSGVVVLANHAHSAKILAGSIDKQYYAVVKGVVSPKSGRIDLPLGKCEGHGIKRIVDQNGERAVTNYHTVLTGNGLSLLSIRLETGRTHQIRAHFAYLGHPLVGDWMYGDSETGNNNDKIGCNGADGNDEVNENYGADRIDRIKVNGKADEIDGANGCNGADGNCEADRNDGANGQAKSNNSQTDGYDRHLLHCGFAWLRHPITGETMCFHSPLPEEMLACFNR